MSFFLSQNTKYIFVYIEGRCFNELDGGDLNNIDIVHLFIRINGTNVCDILHHKWLYNTDMILYCCVNGRCILLSITLLNAMFCLKQEYNVNKQYYFAMNVYHKSGLKATLYYIIMKCNLKNDLDIACVCCLLLVIFF